MALLVGLTGGMGAGKSLAASLLRALGAETIDADEICRQLMLPGQSAWRDIIDRFGDHIVLPGRTLDRQRLAAIVFGDPYKKSILENILHPRVMAEERRLYEEARRRDPKTIMVVDAALLIESGNYKNMDKVVVVTCPEATRVTRLLARKVWAGEDIEKRLRHQMPEAEKTGFADYVVANDSTPEALQSRIEILYRELMTLA